MINIYLKKRMSSQFFKVLRRRLIIKICFFQKLTFPLSRPWLFQDYVKIIKMPPKIRKVKKNLSCPFLILTLVIGVKTIESMEFFKAKYNFFLNFDTINFQRLFKRIFGVNLKIVLCG